MRAVWPHHVQVAAEATETWAAEVHGLLAVGLEQDPLAIGPLLGKPVGSRGRPARQAGLVLAVRPSAVDLLDPGRVELGGEHLAVPGPGRVLAEPGGAACHHERRGEVGARSRDRWLRPSLDAPSANPATSASATATATAAGSDFPYLIFGRAKERRGGAAGGRGSTRPAPRLRVGSQGGISDAIVPGGGTVPGTSLMKVLRPPACGDYPPIRPAVSTVLAKNSIGALDSPAPSLDQLDSDHGPEWPDGRQRRREQGPGRLSPHDRPEDQRAEAQVADAV